MTVVSSHDRHHEPVPTAPTAHQPEPPAPTGWTAWVVFGAVILTLVGSFHLIEGLTALFIFLDIIVIYAVAMHGREMRAVDSY
jgi:predicted lipid-binding transport protein (Tim44 family)